MKDENHMDQPCAQLRPELNRPPKDPRHIHLMGICGTGMASIAGMLKQQGYRVTGSDQNVYPPMSLFLEGLDIAVLQGYGPQNLHPVPDLVIVGNVITRLNPEAAELAHLKIPYLSMPQALRLFAMENRKSIVISGTHGKTTTASLIAWILESAGLDPGFMIGGIPLDFSTNYKLGKGSLFVVEGDEYDTAFFDKGPKFLHYAPWTTILTSIEFDHADIYQDLDHVRGSFQKLIGIIPPEGLLIANGDDPIVAAESAGASCPVTTYGLGRDAQWQAVDVDVREDSTRLTILRNGKEYMKITTPLYGLHNVSNLLSAAALSDFLGLAPGVFQRALRGFRGVKRRQEPKGERGGILVLDDFAHHPTAVRATIQAVKAKYRDRRIIAVFEPRSNSSRRNIFQGHYAVSFDGADLILIPETPMTERIPPEERFSSTKLVRDLVHRGLKALYCPTTQDIIDHIMTEGRKGDVVLVMSNGGFDNLIDRLLKTMENRSNSPVSKTSSGKNG
ncbi:MAG: UDP-N-acetylmuramate:L-alanyl-gamma-D-glutamyl-meso-diaminopimelate ligase [Desulfatiglandales bacterium]